LAATGEVPERELAGGERAAERSGAELGCLADKPAGRERSQLLAQLGRGGHKQQTERVDRLGASLDRGAARDSQHPDHLDQVVACLGRAGRLGGQDCPGCRLRVGRVRLALAPPRLAVRPHHLNDQHLAGAQVPGQRSPLAAGRFDPERLDHAEPLRPGEQPLVARPRGSKLDLVEPTTELIKRHRHVHISMPVHPDSHPDRLKL